jgi:probable addiction module antidote protein
MPIETEPFDSARHLKTEADIALYLQSVLTGNNPTLPRHALGQVARAKALTLRAPSLRAEGEAIQPRRR